MSKPTAIEGDGNRGTRGCVVRSVDPAPPAREAWKEGALSPRALAEFLGRSRSWVFRGMANGQIPYTKIDNGERRVPKSWALDFLAAGEQAPRINHSSTEPGRYDQPQTAPATQRKSR